MLGESGGILFWYRQFINGPEAWACGLAHTNVRLNAVNKVRRARYFSAVTSTPASQCRHSADNLNARDLRLCILHNVIIPVILFIVRLTNMASKRGQRGKCLAVAYFSNAWYDPNRPSATHVYRQRATENIEQKTFHTFPVVAHV